MISNYCDADFKSNDTVPDLLDRCKDTASRSPASRSEPAVEPDRTAMPATLAIPGPDSVRALLILAAESAYELRNGARDSIFLAQLGEQSESLADKLAALPEVYQGVDYSLMFRRARQSADILNETIRREILGKIDENTAMVEMEAALQVVKDIAVEAGKALAFLKVRVSGIR